MGKLVRTFLSDQSGATAIEYSLIAGMIAVVIVSAVKLVGASVTGEFTNVASGFDT